jgi:hypothetical protein
MRTLINLFLRVVFVAVKMLMDQKMTKKLLKSVKKIKKRMIYNPIKLP